jgi:hypothetical protein
MLEIWAGARISAAVLAGWLVGPPASNAPPVGLTPATTTEQSQVLSRPTPVDGVWVQAGLRTRPSAITGLVGIEPHQILTPAAFARALSRLQDLPVALDARLNLRPTGTGAVSVDAFVAERAVLPVQPPALVTIIGRVLFLDELRADIAGPLRAGDLWMASWRWADGRPRVAMALSLPAPGWLPGVATFEASRETQSYDPTPEVGGVSLVRETRRRVGLSFSDWATSWARWHAGVAADRLLDTSFVALDAGIGLHAAHDRLAVAVSGGYWTPRAGGLSLRAGSISFGGRTTRLPTVSFWSVGATVSATNAASPIALWPGAGSGKGRPLFLRAHPLVDDIGVTVGPLLGQRVAQATVEYEHPVQRSSAGTLSVAGFVDSARAWRRLSGLGTSPLFIDAGIGLRVHSPGLGGAIRIDIAHGVRGGGHTTLSAGWALAWLR